VNELSMIDSLIVTVLVDNVIDSSTASASENILSPSQWTEITPSSNGHLQAVHGFSVLIDAVKADERFRVLYDTGSSAEILKNNLHVLGIDANTIREIVISHGHWDHYGGLEWILGEIEAVVPVYVHEKMFYRRGVKQDSKIRDIGQMPHVEQIEAAGGKPIVQSSPELIAGGHLLLSGEIPRLTSFESGFPGHVALKEGEWVDDSLLLDDRCIAANIQDKGLFVISGCSHAGIINMLNEVTRLTGIKTLHGLLGGLHLIGKDEKLKIPPTVVELRNRNPRYVIPGHCTGWNAKQIIAQELSDVTLGLSVGNRYVF